MAGSPEGVGETSSSQGFRPGVVKKVELQLKRHHGSFFFNVPLSDSELEKILHSTELPIDPIELMVEGVVKPFAVAVGRLNVFMENHISKDPTK